MREVIGSAIATELEDPRIGFVTVTSVETSPDLRSARVYVSVLGGEAEREATLAGLRSSHGVLQATIAREMRIKRTPTLSFHYDETPERGVRISRLLDHERGIATVAEPQGRVLGDVAEELRAGGSLPAHDPRGPGRGRARLAAGDAPHPHPARQGLGHVPGGEGVPAAGRVPVPAPRGGLPRAAGRRRGPGDRLPRLREHRPHARRLPAARRGQGPEHRPPPRQHPLRHAEPGRHRGLLHRRDPLRAGEAARRGDHPGDRGRALRGAGHGHRPVHVREHERRPRTGWRRS